MKHSRRDIGSLAVTMLLAQATLSATAVASTADVEAMTSQVEALRRAIVAGDKVQLDELLSADLIYVQSDGKGESKTQFLAAVSGRKLIYKSMDHSEQSIVIAGVNAVVRHKIAGEVEVDGKVNPFKVGAMQIWQKQDGRWRLFARQAFRLA